MLLSYFLKEHDFKKPGKIVNNQIARVMANCFPKLKSDLNSLPDSRQRKSYEIGELYMAGISLFMLKQGSRNALNQDRKDEQFCDNYQKLFGMRLPHLDSTDEIFRQACDEDLEGIKSNMISSLIRNKKLERWKFQGHYVIAVDGTGVVSFDKKHCDCCLKKTSKNGVTSYFHNVLEAKLLTSSGLSLSIATEWISNENKTQFQKQDCEQKAFKRLARKIKKEYPRLPILLVADGLYPCDGFFNICSDNNWKYIVVLKDGTLKTFQEEIVTEKLINPRQNTDVIRAEKDKRTTLNYFWLRELPYKNHLINYVECNETIVAIKTKQATHQRFVHLTNLEVSRALCDGISFIGRLRQKIENEGFNAQKNHGYALQHKYSRISFKAMKTYYQCLQIAHIINQIVEACLVIKTLKNKTIKCTIKYLWKRLLSYLLENKIDKTELQALIAKPFQIRLA